MIPSEELNAFFDAPSIEELWDMHTRRMADYGFDRLIYGYTRYLTPNSMGDPDDFVLLTNHSSEYTDVFIGHGLYFNAPMVRWSLDNIGACSWSVLSDMTASGAMSDKELEVLEFNKTMGVIAGYSISFPRLANRAKGAIALTARRGMNQAEADEIWAEHGDDILLFNNITHQRILSLPNSSQGRNLTNRQKEVLAWVADGKTMQDIALLMELTPTTVEKHLRLARESLSVETTAQAVLKAAFQNQIFNLD